VTKEAAVRRLTIGLCGLLVVTAAAFAALYAGTGHRMYVVHTGSMAPALEPGDVVLDGAPATPERGDVISFRIPGDGVVTHRVVEVTDRGIRTKGDANRTPDSWWVEPDELAGTVQHRLPYAGYALVYLRQPTGAASLVVGTVALVLAWGLFFPPEAAATGRSRRTRTDGRHAGQPA
jgi:signal peptidase